jgi:hypothetical protein
MKKTLILDESIWRCGDNGYINYNDENDVRDVKRGDGDTLLKNDKGFLCCLGQFSVQLDKSTKDDILGEGTPEDLNKVIPLLTKKVHGKIENTSISDTAININDSTTLTIPEKVRKLKSLFKRRGVKIVFKPIKKKK